MTREVIKVKRDLKDAKPMEIKGLKTASSQCDSACTNDCAQSCGCEGDCAASCGCSGSN